MAKMLGDFIYLITLIVITAILWGIKLDVVELSSRAGEVERRLIECKK